VEFGPSWATDAAQRAVYWDRPSSVSWRRPEAVIPAVTLHDAGRSPGTEDLQRRACGPGPDSGPNRVREGVRPAGEIPENLRRDPRAARMVPRSQAKGTFE